MKTILITQARTGSTRLPKKILKKVDNRTLLEIHLERILKTRNVDKVIVATTIDSSDDCIVDLVQHLGVSVYRGSENDVLDRFYSASKEFEPGWIVRVTSDCPLIDPALIDDVIALAQKEDVDYCCNTLHEHFPDGQDVEVFKFSALREAWENAELKSEREHVTPYIRNNSTFFSKNKFSARNLEPLQNFGNIRMTVDEQLDFDLIERLVVDLGTDCTWKEYVDHILIYGLESLNGSIARNEGLLKSLKRD